MAKKQRIPVSATQQPLQTAPFAGLDLGPLPEGPAESLHEPIRLKSKTKGRVILRRETKHRGGKTVVVVTFDPPIAEDILTAFAQSLKQQCGCGGTVHEHTIEIQGEQSTKVRAFFEKQGYRVSGS